MEWMTIISDSIQYIEDHIMEDITGADVARAVNVSSFYFQKGFAACCGVTVGRYIRNRKMVLACRDLLCTEERIIDIAIKYGYDSPDGFTRAFTRFHGASPTAIRREEVEPRSFASLQSLPFTADYSGRCA